MELQASRKLAIELMTKHGLIQQGWQFSFNNRKGGYGVCRYRIKTIELSMPMTQISKEESVKDTILHEIAHALVGSGHGHDYVWQRKCVEIGADPSRTKDINDAVEDVASAREHLLKGSKYHLACKCCDFKRPIARKPTRTYSCPVCYPRKFNSAYILEFRLTA